MTMQERAADLLDYKEGDIVQLKSGKLAGRSGMIIGIRVFEYADGTADLAYRVKLSDRKSIEVSARRLRFVRRENA